MKVRDALFHSNRHGPTKSQVIELNTNPQADLYQTQGTTRETLTNRNLTSAQVEGEELSEENEIDEDDLEDDDGP